MQVIQANESTLHFITRICKKFGAVFKLSDKEFLVTLKSKGKSVTGQDLPKIIIHPEDVKMWNCRFVGRENYNSVKASWRDIISGKEKEIIEGSGEPIFKITEVFQSETSVREAVKAKLKSLKQNYKKLTLKLDGNPKYRAEVPIVAVGFRDKVDGDWIIERAVHSVESRYDLSLDCIAMV